MPKAAVRSVKCRFVTECRIVESGLHGAFIETTPSLVSESLVPPRPELSVDGGVGTAAEGGRDGDGGDRGAGVVEGRGADDAGVVVDAGRDRGLYPRVRELAVRAALDCAE